MAVNVAFEATPVAPPDVPFSHFQTVDYDRLLRVYGQTPVWLVARQGGDDGIVATWLLFETPGNYLSPPKRALVRALDRHLMALHGPVLRPGLSETEAGAVIAALLGVVRRHVLRTVPISTRLMLDPLMSSERRDTWRRAAADAGFSAGKSWTYLARVPATVEGLQAAVKPDRRTKVRKAEKSGMVFACEPTSEGLATYFDLRLATLARNGHAALPVAHFSDTLSVMGPAGIFKVFLARQGERTGAGQLAFVHNGYVYLSGVSIADWALAEGVPANDFLQWHILDWARREGCRLVDFVGAAPDSDDPKLKTIDAFKARWGTELVDTLELSLKVVPIRRYALAGLRRLSLAGD